MNKKNILAFLIIVFLGSTLSISYADQNIQPRPTIAIIDTGLSENIDILKNRIVYQVCILNIGLCPNNESFMEGPGSAILPEYVVKKNGFDHGTIMSTTFALNNQNADIVFVRIVGYDANGNRKLTSAYSFHSALQWVYDNKDKLNIKAISMSQSAPSINPGTDYCMRYLFIESLIDKLYENQIPIFLPTGNEGKNKRISWPACVDKTISIGSASSTKEIAYWSNVDISKTDFFDVGTFSAITVGNKYVRVFGTSVSNQIAAANWMTVRGNLIDQSYQNIYNVLLNSSLTIYRKDGAYGKMINIKGVKV